MPIVGLKQEQVPYVAGVYTYLSITTVDIGLRWQAHLALTRNSLREALSKVWILPRFPTFRQSAVSTSHIIHSSTNAKLDRELSLGTGFYIVVVLPQLRLHRPFRSGVFLDLVCRAPNEERGIEERVDFIPDRFLGFPQEMVSIRR